MSWIEENLDELIIADYYNHSMIMDKLDNEKYIEKLYSKFEKDYTILVCNILESFKNGRRLSDKQKKCLALYICNNDIHLDEEEK